VPLIEYRSLIGRIARRAAVVACCSASTPCASRGRLDRFDHNGWVATAAEQIQAILNWNTFRWAQSHLPEAKTMDDVRFSDLISVTEDDVYEYVLTNGFPSR
jgi:hypothetical protein